VRKDSSGQVWSGTILELVRLEFDRIEVGQDWSGTGS
jgi:hypothetical protein